jgi:CHAD domain-containing protein
MMAEGMPMSVLATESADATAATNKLSKLAHKRLERFATLYPKILVSDAPDSIHDLRVASRRLQQTLRLILAKPKSSTNRKLLRLLRKTRRAFGPCRNVDVSIALVGKRRDAGAAVSLRRAWSAVQQWLEQQRANSLAEARSELKRHDLIDFISRVQTRFDDIHKQPEAASLLHHAAEALTAWTEALAAAKADPVLKRIHGLRVAGKRLRYRIESLVELGDPSVKPLVQGLKMLQDDLGGWHDRQVLQQHIAAFVGRPGFLAEEPGMCRALLLEMERDKQRDKAAMSDVIVKAENLADEWREIKPPETPITGSTTSDQ